MEQSNKHYRVSRSWNDANLATARNHAFELISSQELSNRAKLKFIIAELNKHLEENGQEARMLAYTYAVYALIFHEKYGGLEGYQLKQLFGIAKNILQVEKIKPGRNSCAHLYSDLHSIQSQILRRQGEHFSAAMEQHLAHYSIDSHSDGVQAFQNYTLGNRYLRLGHVKLAISYFRKALADQEALEKPIECTLSLVRALRIFRDYNSASTLCLEIRNSHALNENQEREIAWEEICIRAQSTLDLREMLKSTAKTGMHYQNIYIAEATLWAHAAKSMSWLEKIPTTGTLNRRNNLKMRRMGSIFEVIDTLESCRNYDIPLYKRIKGLSHVLSRSHLLMSIDKELLLLAAAARFLNTSKAQSLLQLVLANYQNLSLQVTSGVSADSLGVLSDLTLQS